MKLYSQKNTRWSGKRLGTCSNWTIGKGGCFITCLSMIKECDPDYVNRELTNKGGYSNGCNLISSKAAEILCLEYKGKVYSNPGTVCIAETDHYKSSGYKQHFFIYADGKKVDPLHKYPKWTDNNYNIVSYRLFSNPKKEGKETKKDMKNQDFYDDKRKAQGWSSVEDWVGAAKEYKEERDKLRKEKEELSKKIKQLEDSLKNTETTLGKTKANYEEITARFKREENEAEATIKDLNKKLRKKEAEIEKLKSNKKSSESATESQILRFIRLLLGIKK